MKQSFVSASWFIRNSKRYRFSLPNKICDHKLKPIAFVIFSYLCYSRNNYFAGTLTPEVIATGTHLTANTVKKYLSALMSKGLITSGYDLTPDFQCSNGENFFTLPNEIFLLELPPSAFMVYAYLLLIEDRRTHTCHPSYNTIATGTGMSKNTTLKSISTLQEMVLISVEPSSYFDQHGMKWRGNNLYTILPINLAVDIFHQRQLCQLELAAEQIRVRRQQERDPHCRPRTAL